MTILLISSRLLVDPAPDSQYHKEQTSRFCINHLGTSVMFVKRFLSSKPSVNKPGTNEPGVDSDGSAHAVVNNISSGSSNGNSTQQKKVSLTSDFKNKVQDPHYDRQKSFIGPRYSTQKEKTAPRSSLAPLMDDQKNENRVEVMEEYSIESNISGLTRDSEFPGRFDDDARKLLDTITNTKESDAIRWENESITSHNCFAPFGLPTKNELSSSPSGRVGRNQHQIHQRPRSRSWDRSTTSSVVAVSPDFERGRSPLPHRRLPDQHYRYDLRSTVSGNRYKPPDPNAYFPIYASPKLEPSSDGTQNFTYDNHRYDPPSMISPEPMGTRLDNPSRNLGVHISSGRGCRPSNVPADPQGKRLDMVNFVSPTSVDMYPWSPEMLRQSEIQKKKCQVNKPSLVSISRNIVEEIYYDIEQQNPLRRDPRRSFRSLGRSSSLPALNSDECIKLSPVRSRKSAILDISIDSPSAGHVSSTTHLKIEEKVYSLDQETDVVFGRPAHESHSDNPSPKIHGKNSGGCGSTSKVESHFSMFENILIKRYQLERSLSAGSPSQFQRLSSHSLSGNTPDRAFCDDSIQTVTRSNQHGHSSECGTILPSENLNMKEILLFSPGESEVFLSSKSFHAESDVKGLALGFCDPEDDPEDIPWPMHSIRNSNLQNLNDSHQLNLRTQLGSPHLDLQNSQETTPSQGITSGKEENVRVDEPHIRTVTSESSKKSLLNLVETDSESSTANEDVIHDTKAYFAKFLLHKDYSFTKSEEGINPNVNCTQYGESARIQPTVAKMANLDQHAPLPITPPPRKFFPASLRSPTDLAKPVLFSPIAEMTPADRKKLISTYLLRRELTLGKESPKTAPDPPSVPSSHSNFEDSLPLNQVECRSKNELSEPVDSMAPLSSLSSSSHSYSGSSKRSGGSNCSSAISSSQLQVRPDSDSPTKQSEDQLWPSLKQHPFQVNLSEPTSTEGKVTSSNGAEQVASSAPSIPTLGGKTEGTKELFRSMSSESHGKTDLMRHRVNDDDPIPASCIPLCNRENIERYNQMRRKKSMGYIYLPPDGEINPKRLSL